MSQAFSVFGNDIRGAPRLGQVLCSWYVTVPLRRHCAAQIWFHNDAVLILQWQGKSVRGLAMTFQPQNSGCTVEAEIVTNSVGPSLIRGCPPPNSRALRKM